MTLREITDKELTGYDGGLSGGGGDSDGDVDGVAVEARLAGPGGVPQVVSVLLLFAEGQAAARLLHRAAGGAVLLLPLPEDEDQHQHFTHIQ